MRLSLLLLLVLLLLGCDHKEKVSSEDIEREEQLKAKLSEMVSKHKASDNWLQILAKCDSLNLPITTLHLQQAFAETSGHPFLFHVHFDDVFKRDDKHFACFELSSNFESLIFLLHPVYFYFELSCTEKQVQELLKENRDWWRLANLAIVARVHGVRKLRFSFEAIPDCCYEEGSEEAYIEIEPSRVFLIRGELLDFCLLK